MLTVATVLRSGAEYTPVWVRRLRRQVAEHLDREHRFVCLSDVEIVDVETILLEHDWPGYWSKLELYRAGLFDGRVIYFDLDTLIVGDITPLADYTGPFAALRDFGSPEIQASGVLMFDGRDPPELYELAREERPFDTRPNSRSDLWWNRHLKADVIQDLYPGLVGSYKMDGLEMGPRDYSIVAFHGTPRQHELPGTWVERAWTWKEAA